MDIKNLLLGKKADLLAHLIYDLSLSFPKEEIYGLTSQLRRAVLSVVLNIVEGYARSSKKEFHRFLAIALGSLAETEYLLEFAYKRKYLTASEFERVSQIRVDVGQLVWKLYISQQ